MRQRRTKKPTSETRKRIEAHVVAHNSILKDRIEFMEATVLIANCHPLDRTKHAKELYDEGLLDQNEAARYFKVYVSEKDE